MDKATSAGLLRMDDGVWTMDVDVRTKWTSGQYFLL
jgi:hypothetical protein